MIALALFAANMAATMTVLALALAAATLAAQAAFNVAELAMIQIFDGIIGIDSIK